MELKQHTDQDGNRNQLLLKVKEFRLCLVMIALESFVSFEELYMLATLQRVNVPTMFVSSPGTFSSAFGIFFIPFLGWASDRFECCACIGQKRTFALLTAILLTTGSCLLVFVNSLTLYEAHRCNQTENYTGNAVNFFNSNRFDESVHFNDLNLIRNNQPALIQKGGDIPHNDSIWNFNSNLNWSSDPAQVAYESILNNSSIRSTVGNFTEVSISLPTREYLNQTLQNSIHYGSGLNNIIMNPVTNASDDSEMTSCQDTISGGGNAAHITALGILGILGFSLSDAGYDSSMSTMRAYMLTVAHPSQHSAIHATATLTGAVGGCMTSLLGFVKLSALFQVANSTDIVVDAGAAQRLVQSVILLTSILLFTFCSLSTGSEGSHKTGYLSETTVIPEPSGEEKEVATDSDKHLLLSTRNVDTAPRYKTYQSNGFISSNTNDRNVETEESTTKPCSLKRLRQTVTISVGKYKKMTGICTIAFLGFVCNYSYFIYVTNFVAESIYNGDPYGAPDSQEYADYVEGVHMGSLGMLVFYCAYFIFNLGHNKCLKKISMKTEYLLASASCAVMMMSLALTDNIVVFFVNSFTMAIYRSALYTIPFILANNSLRDTVHQAKQNYDGTTDKPALKTGFVMAAVSAMIPASYLTVSLVMGPLIQVTGSPGTPIFIASGACLLGLFIIMLVKFD